MKNNFKHVAIIPDGNRRWAKKNSFQPWVGHQKGVKVFGSILEKSKELKIPYLTFWGGSWDNLIKRPKKEVDFSFKIYDQQFKEIAKNKKIHQNKVKVSVLGRWKEVLPKQAQESIKKAVKATENYNDYFLTFLLAYNGTDEMLSCFEKILKLANNSKIKITNELIKKNLWTKNLPPTDLVIRTGCQGDPHLSTGFMMWDTAYSQLYFSKTLFPDFNSEEFSKIIQYYSEKERRLGV